MAETKTPARAATAPKRASTPSPDADVDADVDADIDADIDGGDVGQSGYASGRSMPDPALARELRTENPTVAEDVDDEHLADELATDERFHRRGGVDDEGHDGVR